MAKKFVRENVPLSRFGVLVAQLESIVASAAQQPPDAVLCFDLLSDLLSAIDEEPKESILLWQRKCEDALYSLLTLGARRPVRHLASLAMARIISKGDTISIYSRASSLQGFLSDGKRSEPLRFTGAAQCLGELYRSFGRRITSGLLETTIIATKLMKFPEVFVRQEALRMLESALEGSGGTAAFTAYSEAFRLIMRSAVGDKSFIVRIAAARCLKAFANIGGPGLGVGELENSANCCVKALEDPVSSVRDAFAEALGMLIALGMNPDAQVQPRVKGHIAMAKKLEGGLQRHLSSPFMKVNGARAKDVRIGLTFSWVFFLQAIRMKYLHPDSDLQNFASQVMDMLRFDGADNAQALACVLYILRVGVTDQMTEPTQRGFLVLLGKQLQSSDVSPSMKIAALRTLAYTLKTLGEVPLEFREVLDDTVVASLSHSSQLVRIEAALALRALAEVDPTCVGGLVSYGVTTLNALRENVSFEKGNNLKVELDSLHGQTIVLAALVTISPKLPLGYPARLPRSVLEVSKEMLTACSRIPMVANVEREAGWLLLASLLASMPKEELEDQVFDILSLWASVFSGNPEDVINDMAEIASGICVWSAAVDALTAFVRCFVSPSTFNSGILLQPVVVYLSRALSYISFVAAKEIPDMKPAVDIFIIRILIAYQSLPDTMIYKTDHSQIIQICTTPFRDATGCVESSCLRLLLDKRDALLGPWTPGRDWFEDELRAFEGGKDGLLPCIWESEVATFPQADTISKTVVNQMLLCFGIMFASQDSGGMLSLLGMMEQCLKSGKKQPWHSASVTNTCVGLLCGLKALLALRPQPLALEILNSAQTIFLGILVEGDICASQRRASAEGLGLLARLGNDIFTARMTKLLLGDLTVTTDLTYAGSIAFALGCIHRSAGGMALSSLVPSTVSSISLLAKSSNPGLQIWSLHGLILTIEASGLSYVSHVQATLGLAMDLLQSQENVWLDLQQGVGQLINAIVAVLGPELAPGSIFFSRCKSVVAEISFQQEMATLLESVRFTQQLVLFAPQALSMHTHLQTLLPTLSSRQPTLRHMGISTLRHLIEKDPVAIINEQIEDELFHMLDEETDSEIGNLVRTTIMRLLYVSCPSCPSRWLLICRKMVLASSARRKSETDNSERDSANAADGDTKFGFGEDDDNMVSSYNSNAIQGHIYDVSNVNRSMDKNLRFRTRIFAAECLSHLPTSVGKNSAHFDLTLARKSRGTVHDSGDWLVLKLQELISLAYQISTMQFENMQPIGVGLLSTIVDKFEMIPDPEFPGHLLLEQYQAQLVSAVRNALNPSSGPVLLEAGLQLATKILTCGIISGDQAAVKRIFSLISRPLNDFKDLYYPSFAEWVSCKIKVRLLAAHASLKCYTFALLRRPFSELPDEYVALTSLFSQRSSTLGRYWIYILKDYSWICFRLLVKRNWKPFLDEIQSPLVSSKLLPCLEEAWPVILQAIALDAVPASSSTVLSDTTVENSSVNSLISGYSMVELNANEFQFLWGFALLVLFQGQHSVLDKQIIPLNSTKANFGGDSPVEEASSGALKLYEIVLPVFQFLSTERFFSAGFLTLDACKELLQVFSYSRCAEDAWNSLAVSVLMQIVQNCPDSFLENEDFAYSTMELCSAYLLKILLSTGAMKADEGICEDSISLLLKIAKTLMMRFEPKKQLKWVLAVLLIGYKCLKRASTEQCFSQVNNFIQSTFSLLKKQYDDKLELADDSFPYMRTILGACLNVVSTLTRDFIEDIYLMQNKRPNLIKLLQMKLFFSLEQAFSFAELGHEIGHCEECMESNIYFPMYRVSVNCFKDVLADSNMQVREIGLQVLKSVLHRSVNLENSSFFLFFAGELFSDIFLIIHEISKKPLARERGTLVDDCLGILVLLQTLSKGTECEKSIMKLLLEAVFLVLSASEDGVFQETNDIRGTAIRLVSHLAQIPSSAVKLKDALLGMPITHRQQLQDILRASAAQDSVATLNKSAAPSLAIKLPMQNEEIGAMTTLSTSTSHSDRNSPEEEDDWEAFQSFPASIDTAATNPSAESAPESLHLTENSTVLDFNSGNDASQRGSVSFPPNNAEEMIEAKPLESSGDEIFETVCSGSAEDMIEAEHLESSREGDMFETGGSGIRKEIIGPEHLKSREGEISDSAGSGNADEFISTECLESSSEEEILETSSGGNARQIEAEYLGSSREGKIFEREDNESRTEEIRDVERLKRSRVDSELSQRNSIHSDCPGPDQNNSQVLSDYKPTENAEGSPSKSDSLNDNEHRITRSQLPSDHSLLEESSGFLKSEEPDARTDRDATAEADQGIGKNSRTDSEINEPHPEINDNKGITESENDGTKPPSVGEIART